SYIKSALLYSDQVTLISPLAYLIYRMTDEKNGIDEKNVLKLAKEILPLAKSNDRTFYEEAYPILNQFSDIIYSKRYKAVPYVKRLEIQRDLKKFAKEICEKMVVMVGENDSRELQILINSGQVKIEKFEHSIGDVDLCVKDYFKLLARSIESSYPLFDKQSNDLMKAAVNSRIVSLSSVNRKKITHAGMADNIIRKLPSFTEASMNELIDIKKELGQPLKKFRGKMLGYSESIQSMPWDNDFADECEILYDKEIVPAILEIEEYTKDNSFVKNIGKKFFTDEGVWKSTGGLAISIAAGGVISAFNGAISSDVAMLVSGGAYAASRVASAYEEYSTNKKTIERKDLYFYYEAGNRLKK
ncbi:MAG: hypothetical protein LUF92_11200, partial [Clostridiales bacterium]|nr:hypothetical protein [Clostridiales bacterium]